jgi:cell division transport system ATP-binding protein
MHAGSSGILPTGTAGTPLRGAPEPGRVGPAVPTVTGTAPASAPIWVRAETGPVLLPGEHAPWRAAPVAPPAEEPDADGRAIFFAAPVSAQRTETGAVPVAQTEPGSATGFEDVPLDGDGADDGDLRGVARHRDQLPDHLDFITGLGLRGRKGDDDEVGPSS